VHENWSFQKSTAGHARRIEMDLASYLNLYQLHNHLWEKHDALHHFFEGTLCNVEYQEFE